VLLTKKTSDFLSVFNCKWLLSLSYTLEIWVMNYSISLKMAPFDGSYATFYWSTIVNNYSLVPFTSYLTSKNTVTLKFYLS